MFFFHSFKLICFFILPFDNKIYFFCREKGKQSHFKIQALEERDSSQDSEYWSKYAKLIDPQKERLWDALIEGLDKYRYVGVVFFIDYGNAAF